MRNWLPDLAAVEGPRYLAIAEAIAHDIALGVLTPGDRLPPQRYLAQQLKVDFTTVARGYVEAARRGLIESTVGRGSFVKGNAALHGQGDPRRGLMADFSMNMPPEPNDPELIARMQDGLASVSGDLFSLLRYQGFGGSPVDKEAASAWLSRRGLVPSQERVFVSPGAHPALLGILSIVAKPGDTILSEAITYPGVRSISAQLGLTLRGLAMDADGILPDALAEACRMLSPKALYLNPTLQNPLTLTSSDRRRNEICAVARRFGVTIIEDDAYGFIPTHGPAPLAAIAPDICWHIGGLSKCIGAGLRIAYVVVPDTKSAWTFNAAMRTSSVMASPLMAALATRWIEDGTADSILRFIRTEAAARQRLAAQYFEPGTFLSDPLSFNIWLPLTSGWSRTAFIGHVRSYGLGVVASDAFTVEGAPAEAVRVGLGGPVSRTALAAGLEFMSHALESSPELASAFF
ncbi:MAG: PLP-dependent aminotransferase family protein [Cypionkella sp.]